MPDMITRQNVSTLSEWAMGDNVGPTDILLKSFSARSGSMLAYLLLIPLVVGIGMAVEVMRRKM